MKSELTKALEYERMLQKEGFLKDIKQYQNMLDYYAQEKGFYSFDEMITELSND